MRNIRAYAALNETSPLAPFVFQTRDPGAGEIEIRILYCGICHTDVHQGCQLLGHFRLTGNGLDG